MVVFAVQLRCRSPPACPARLPPPGTVEKKVEKKNAVVDHLLARTPAAYMDGKLCAVKKWAMSTFSVTVFRIRLLLVAVALGLMGVAGEKKGAGMADNARPTKVVQAWQSKPPSTANIAAVQLAPAGDGPISYVTNAGQRPPDSMRLRVQARERPATVADQDPWPAARPTLPIE